MVVKTYTNHGRSEHSTSGTIVPVRDHILVEDMEFGERISRGGIIITDDDHESRGIRSRWAKVYAVGHEQKDINPGEWVLVAHGRWTRGAEIKNDDGSVTVIRRVDPDDIFGVSDVEPPADVR